MAEIWLEIVVKRQFVSLLFFGHTLNHLQYTNSGMVEGLKIWDGINPAHRDPGDPGGPVNV